jgi:hypothetical protein
MARVPSAQRHCQSAPPSSTVPSSPLPAKVPPSIGTTRRSPAGAAPSERTSPTSAAIWNKGATSIM